MVGLTAKGLRIPERWTASEFARQGRLLILALARIAKLAQRKASPAVARKAQEIFRGQIDRVIESASIRAAFRAGMIHGTKRDIELTVAQHEAIWLEAIQEALAGAGIQAALELAPPIQSVMAQGYSRVGTLLAQPSDPEVNARIADSARGIAQKITRVNQTTRDRLEGIIRRGIADGLTVTEVAKKLRAEGAAMAHNRSLTISRTELNNAWTQGSVIAFQESETLTHVSVIGCEAREPDSPQYRGESTCNIEDVPVIDADKLEFHINHTGTMIPSGFREPGNRG